MRSCCRRRGPIIFIKNTQCKYVLTGLQIQSHYVISERMRKAKGIKGITGGSLIMSRTRIKTMSIFGIRLFQRLLKMMARLLFRQEGDFIVAESFIVEEKSFVENVYRSVMLPGNYLDKQNL